MNIMKIFLLTLLTFCAATSVHSQNSTPLFGKVLYGEVMEFGGVEVTFEKVISDSRCPKNTNCIWAGEAKVLLAVSRGGKLLEKKEVVISASNVTNDELNILFNSKEFVIRCVVLSPYPATPDKIP